jgi:hypothetical protein
LDLCKHLDVNYLMSTSSQIGEHLKVGAFLLNRENMRRHGQSPEPPHLREAKPPDDGQAHLRPALVRR